MAKADSIHGAGGPRPARTWQGLGRAWLQPALAAGPLLALLVYPAVLAGEISASSGPLGLGTRINGQEGGSCSSGLCSVAGGTSAGANLFHRFNSFDTRGAITGVSIDSGAHTSVVMGVLNPLGTFLNRNISLSGPAQLIFLSPGGVQLGAGAAFSNVPRLSLSTASSLAVGGGRFDVFGTTGSQAALLNGVPQAGRGGFSTDAEALRQNGITANGDLVVRGGLITVDRDLLFDAQAGNVLLQGGTLQVPGGSVELGGKAVTVAAGAVLDVSSAFSSPASVVAPAVADGGTIRIAAGLQGASVAGQLSALGRGEAVGGMAGSGTAGSGTAGKGGRIEITGERVALTGASLDASGLAAGGTVLLGGDLRGANPAVPNSISTTVDGASTVRADALAAGDGGKVVAYASQYTAVDGLLSSRGGPAGGNGGFVETSGATVVLTRAPDLVAPLGKGGSWLIDPIDITIKDIANFTLKGVFGLDSAGNSAGANPTSALTQGANGKLYGTTAYGGAHGKGAIFEFDPSRVDAVSISIKASFDGSNGANPFAALVQGSYEKYYGTTAYGGAYGKGAIFEFNPSSSVSESIVLKGSFDGSNGANPYAALVKGSNNNYYGTTAYGGAHDQGSIFEFNPSSSVLESIVRKGSFGGLIADTLSNGANPYASLTAIQDSNLFYGTTFYGGANGKGAIFEFNPLLSDSQSIVLKASFGDLNAANLNNGEHPAAALVKGNDQKYYGTTYKGGEYANGSIFEFDPLTQAGSNPIALKGSFNGSNGAYATVDLIAAADNSNSNGANCNSNGIGCKFYGTTPFGGAYGNGVIFEFDSSKPIGTSILSLVSFGNDNGNGVNPEAPLTRLTSGDKTVFYGTTANGGTNGKGTIFEFLPNNFPSAVSSLAIESALNAGGDVTIDTTNSLGNEAGDIAVRSPISKTAGANASLTLKAHNNIRLNANISSTSGSLDLNLNSDLDQNGTGTTSLDSGVNLALNDGTASFNGNTNLAGKITNSTIKQIGSGLITVNNASFDGATLGSDLTASGTMAIENGSLVIPAGKRLTASNLKVSGGLVVDNGHIQATKFSQSGGVIAGDGGLSVLKAISRSGGQISPTLSEVYVNQAQGDLMPGAFTVKEKLTFYAENGKLILDSPLEAEVIKAYGNAGVELLGAASLKANSQSINSIDIRAGAGYFFNAVGSSVLSVANNASWSIYSTRPLLDQLGGLVPSFKQYSMDFSGLAPAASPLGTGNGLFYKIAPTISPSLIGSVAKVYDATAVASISGSNLGYAGAIGGDTVQLRAALVGAYDSKNAGIAKLVTAQDISLVAAFNDSVPVYGYNLNTTTVSGNVGIITKAPVAAGFEISDKKFDGKTRADISKAFLVGLYTGDEVYTLGHTANFADTVIGLSKPVRVMGFSLYGPSAGNYQLSSDVFTSYASIVEPNNNIKPPGGSVLDGKPGNVDNAIKFGNIDTSLNSRLGNDAGVNVNTQGLSSSSIGISFGTSVPDVGIPVAFQDSNVTTMAPEAANQSSQQGAQSAAESASGPSVTNVSPEAVNQSSQQGDQSATRLASGSSVTNVSPEAANQSYQQGDQSAAESVSKVLGLAGLGSQLATTPARLQMAMQEATDIIRQLPSPSGLLR